MKLLLFLTDIALTNAWIYYELANEKKRNKDDARADFFFELASELVRDDIDFEAKYKCNASAMEGTGRVTVVILITIMMRIMQ